MFLLFMYDSSMLIVDVKIHKTIEITKHFGSQTVIIV